LDCSVTAIKTWEANEREPSVRFIVSLASLFGMPSDLECRRVIPGLRVIPGADKILTLMEFVDRELQRGAEA